MSTNTCEITESAQQTTKNFLSARHYKQWVEGRGLDPRWVHANCWSVNAKEASDLLGYTAQSDGVMIRGANYQVQFRPDKPWLSEKDKAQGQKKAPKYRSPRASDDGESYDAILPNHPDEPSYWDNLEALKELCYKIDGHPCIMITEGGAKAISGCQNDLPTIALLGVEMGLTPAKADPQGKRYLVESVERLANAGFGFCFAFDADAATNISVGKAQYKMAWQLKKFDAPLYSVTGLWSVDEGKGMDDYIKNHGRERFKREVMGKAVDIEAWEKQFTKSGDGSQGSSQKKSDKPVPRLTALEIASRYKVEWAYHNEQQTWRHFNGKVWEAVHHRVFGQIIFNEVESMGIEYHSDSFIENVLKTLERRLLVPEWITFDRMKWIAFNDGVLSVETGILHEHSPGFRFTNYLKRDYTPLNVIDPNTALLDQLRLHAPECYSWFMQVQDGDPLKVLKLLAIINGVIKYRFFDLQYFVQLYGLPGTGKSTFARLLQSLVGKGNYQGSRLSKLNDDNEIAKIIDTQLVVCPDEKKQVGDFSGLLSLTGGDPISYRKIYQEATTGFFYGTVLLISNVALFAGDTSGIDRRLCLVTFDHPIPTQMRSTSIEKRLEAELSPLTALALAMPDQMVTDLILGTGEASIPDFKRSKWLHKTINDSVALFVEERLIKDPRAEIMLGGKSGDIHNTAYGAYMAFVEENNSKSAFSTNNFREHLVEVCREAGWDGVKAKRMNNGWKLCGLRLRCPGVDDAIPRVSESFGQKECRECNPSVGERVGLEPAPCKESVGCVGLKPNNEPEYQLKESNPNDSPKEEKAKTDGCSPYTPTLPMSDKGSSPTPPPTPEPTPATPAPTEPPALSLDAPLTISLPLTQPPVKEGSRVQYTGTRFQQYKNLPLTIHGVDAAWGVACCRTPDGSITTWMPLADLKRV